MTTFCDNRVGLVLLIVGVFGCRSGVDYPTAVVEGEVTVDGQPLPRGTMTFTPLEIAGTAVSAEINNGRFTAVDVPAGRVRVSFNATRETGRMITDQETGETFPEVVHLVAPRYVSQGVEVSVAEGRDEHDFRLTAR
jgi:hypothetical protein